MNSWEPSLVGMGGSLLLMFLLVFLLWGASALADWLDKRREEDRDD